MISLSGRGRFILSWQHEKGRIYGCLSSAVRAKPPREGREGVTGGGAPCAPRCWLVGGSRLGQPSQLITIGTPSVHAGALAVGLGGWSTSELTFSRRWLGRVRESPRPLADEPRVSRRVQEQHTRHHQPPNPMCSDDYAPDRQLYSPDCRLRDALQTGRRLEVPNSLLRSPVCFDSHGRNTACFR